jgi:hypothetical protein
MKEGPHFDVGESCHCEDLMAPLGRNPDAGQPDYRLVFVREKWGELDLGHIGQGLLVQSFYPTIAPQRVADTPELGVADCGLKIGQPVIVAHALVPIGAVRRHAVIAQTPD